MQAKAEAKLAKQNDRARMMAQVKLEKEKAWRVALQSQELKRRQVEKQEAEKMRLADKACVRSSTALTCTIGL